MRIAFCICRHAAVGAIPVVELLRSVRDQGHEAFVVALSQNGSIPAELFICANLLQVSSSAWWKEQDFDLVFAYSFSFYISVAEAVQDSGTRVILDCDSDGRISTRLWPLDALRQYLNEQHTLWTKLRVLKHWAVNFIWSRDHEANALELLKRCDLVRIESYAACENLQKFMAYRGIKRPQQDVHVIPFCAPLEVFSSAPSLEKNPQMVIAGRLESHQKNTRTLIKVTQELIDRIPSLTVSVLSRGECPQFRDLAQRFPSRVTYRRDESKEEVSRTLQESRILFSASRFETLPVIGIEALCMGCTLVATPLDGYVDLTNANQYGTLADTFSVNALVKAFLNEWELWENGGRCPSEIAAAARSRFHPDVVARQLIEAADHCLGLEPRPLVAKFDNSASANA